MSVAKVFMNGRSQAVRLPKDCRFNEDEIIAKRVGDMVILFPRHKAWDLFEKSLEQFTDDFMADRAQPARAEKRKPL